jgi:hypothetical protein
VGAGQWATIVPHTWSRAMPVILTAKLARMVNPDIRAQVSPATRAFVAAAKSLAMNDLIDQGVGAPASR